jgi:hypothetical protein|tara:strand:- start:831 stop:1415 length:585 start_codon:yes stop_codon:yes gene_type:complete
MTSSELIGEHIDLINEKMMLENELLHKDQLSSSDLEETESEYKHIVNELTILQQTLKKKMDNIDKFMVNLNKRKHLIVGEIEAQTFEMARLKKRKNAISSTLQYFNEHLLPSIIHEIGDKNGVFETNTARYKLYNSYGPVKIDEQLLGNDYKQVKMIDSINKAKARKDAIHAHKAGTQFPNGISIYQIEKVRRS